MKLLAATAVFAVLLPQALATIGLGTLTFETNTGNTVYNGECLLYSLTYS
jgi:hypothetical protein